MTTTATPRAEHVQHAPTEERTSAREALLAQHLGLVYHIARQFRRARGNPLELDELVSAGTLGLIDAFDHFDPSRGLAFSTFAAPRVRGAMLDELRRQDRIPRSLRHRVRTMRATTESLTHALGRAPADAELAATLGVDLPTLWRWQADAERVHHVSLDADRSRGGDAAMPDECLTTTSRDAIDALIAREDVETLRDAVLALEEQERTVLSLCYFEGLRLVEIARVLQVSESRVSQVRSRAIARLRARLQSFELAG